MSEIDRDWSASDIKAALEKTWNKPQKILETQQGYELMIFKWLR